MRDGVILAHSQFITLKDNETVSQKTVRYRTCGDMPITGAVESEATTLEAVIQEIATTGLQNAVPEPMINVVKLPWRTVKKRVISRYYTFLNSTN